MNTALVLRGTIFPAWEIWTGPLTGLYGQAVDKAMLLGLAQDWQLMLSQGSHCHAVRSSD